MQKKLQTETKEGKREKYRRRNKRKERSERKRGKERNVDGIIKMGN
jgi:hypothetical protein